MTELTAPALADEVVLSVPGRESLAARVHQQGPDFAELQLLAAPRTPMAVLERGEIFVEFQAYGAFWRVVGTLHGLAAPLGGPLGFVESVRFSFRGAPELLHRRAYTRTEFVARVFLAHADESPVACVTMNVSGGGLLVRALGGRDIGDTLAFRLELFGGQPPITGRCDVVRITPEGFVGVQFSEIADGDRERLVAFAEQRERLRRS